MRHNGEKIILAPFLIAEKTDKLLALARISPVYRQLMFHKGTKFFLRSVMEHILTAFYFAPAQPESLHRRATLIDRRPLPTLRSINNEKLINRVEDVLSEQLIGGEGAS